MTVPTKFLKVHVHRLNKSADLKFIRYKQVNLAHNYLCG